MGDEAVSDAVVHRGFGEFGAFEGVVPVLVDDGATWAKVCPREKFDAEFVVEEDGEVFVGHAVCRVDTREVDYGV